jgi:hypothetical protein
MGNEIIWDLS